MQYRDLSKQRCVGWLGKIGKAYDDLFDDPNNTTAGWLKWWDKGQPKNSPAHYANKLLEEAALLEAAMSDGREFLDHHLIWKRISDYSYYAKDMEMPQIYIKSEFAQPGKVEIKSLIAAEFVAGVFVNPLHPKKLHVITTPRVITKQGKKHPFGQFRIAVNFLDMPQHGLHGIKIHKHSCREVMGVIHPHAYAEGRCCLGEVGTPIQKHFAAGMLYEAVSLIVLVLNTHNKGGYSDVKYFQKDNGYGVFPVCAFCEHKGNKGFISCRSCKARHCGNCRKKAKYRTGAYLCHFCGKALPKVRGTQKNLF